MQSEIDQVLTVCPHVEAQDVMRDLNYTANAEETINRIFDGTFLSGFGEDLSPASSPQQQAALQDPLDDDSDSELPDICLKKLKPNRPAYVTSTSNKSPPNSRFQDRHTAVLDTKTEPVQHQVDSASLPQGSRSPSPDEELGRVDIWLQQSQFSSRTNKSRENTSTRFDLEDNVDGESLRTKCKSSKVNQKTKDGRTRKISVSSSDDEISVEQVLKNNNKTTVSEFKTKRSCSPISVSDSDDEEELLTLTLKQRIQGYTKLPEEGTQSTMYSMSTESMDSSSQQTVDTYSSVETADSQDPGKKKKRKRNPEEIEESKRQALEKKRQRELAKEAKKQEIEKVKEQKKALQAAKKADRPEECMKYVRVVLDPTLLEDVGGAAILTSLESSDSKYTIESQPIPSMVSWRRLDTGLSLGEDIQLQSMQTEKDESETLILLPTSCFVDMVYVFKQEQQGVYGTGEESLRTHTQNIQRLLRGKQVTLMVMNMEAYFRKQKNSHNRNFRSAVLGTQVDAGKKKRRKKGVEEITTKVSRVDVEEALVDLQLHTDVNVRFAEKAEQVAELIAMFTKSVAETPFKRERDKASFSFHVDTEWAGGIRVSKDGIGLLKLWRQQLQQFRNVSPEIASAIVAVYPSPRLLLQAYSRCRSVSEAQKLLQDIVIRRGEGVLATTRRVGGVLSKKVHTVLTSHNGELVV